MQRVLQRLSSTPPSSITNPFLFSKWSRKNHYLVGNLLSSIWIMYPPLASLFCGSVLSSKSKQWYEQDDPGIPRRMRTMTWKFLFQDILQKNQCRVAGAGLAVDDLLQVELTINRVNTYVNHGWRYHHGRCFIAEVCEPYNGWHRNAGKSMLQCLGQMEVGEA